MDWQLVTAGAAVAAAVTYLARSAWHSWRRSRAGCGGSCGCTRPAAGAPGRGDGVTLIPLEQVTLRRKEADRP